MSFHVTSGADAEQKPVVDFAEPEIKSLVLNLTKAEAIASIAGDDDMDAWIGVKIRISCGVTRFQGKKVACLVVDEPDDIDQAIPTKRAV